VLGASPVAVPVTTSPGPVCVKVILPMSPIR
jgi:hypothetical protein